MNRELSRLQSMVSQRIGYNRVVNTFPFFFHGNIRTYKKFSSVPCITSVKAFLKPSYFYLGLSLI